MFISFIITYHNEPSWMLKECLQSILAIGIEEKEREIILIDDGSESSPLPELGEIKEQIVYHYQENKGLSEARNKGIELVQGEYIQFVDSDDFLLPEVYKDILEYTRHNKLDICQFRFTTKPNIKVNFNSKSPYNKEQFRTGKEYLCNNNLRAAACLLLFKRELLGALRFKPKILHEDALFTPLLILQATRFASIKSTAYFYRQHATSIMNSQDSEHKARRLRDAITVIKDLQHKLAETSDYSTRRALTRVIEQQVIAHLYTTFILYRSLSRLRQEVHILRALGFYPLPIRSYTWKHLLLSAASHLF